MGLQTELNAAQRLGGRRGLWVALRNAVLVILVKRVETVAVRTRFNAERKPVLRQ